MNFEYYCGLNASCFKQKSITVSKENIECFLTDGNINLSETKKLTIVFNRKEYDVTFRYVKRDKNKGGSYYQLKWNKDLNEALSKEFIYSYITFMEENIENNLQKEYMVFKRKTNEKRISLVPVIKINTQFDKLFKKLFDVNFFGWDNPDDNEHIIIHNSPWYEKKELSKYSNEANVIYYLIDEKNKKLYIGSTIKLGERFKTERDEIPNWNKFRYDKIHPKYSFILRRIEHHTIGAFKYFMENDLGKSKHSILELSEYTLVNKSQYN
jgi:hypothetical protein